MPNENDEPWFWIWFEDIFKHCSRLRGNREMHMTHPTFCSCSNGFVRWKRTGVLICQKMRIFFSKHLICLVEFANRAAANCIWIERKCWCVVLMMNNHKPFVRTRNILRSRTRVHIHSFVLIHAYNPCYCQVLPVATGEKLFTAFLRNILSETQRTQCIKPNTIFGWILHFIVVTVQVTKSNTLHNWFVCERFSVFYMTGF